MSLASTIKDLAKLGLYPVGRRQASLWAPLGDSRVDQIHLDHGNFLNISNANHFGWGNALSGHRITLSGNWGNSGDRSDQMMARLATALSSGAGTLYIHIGANDLAQAFTGFVSTAGPMAGQTINLANVARHILANVTACHTAALAAGFTRSVIVLEPGASNFAQTQLAAMLEYNERLRDWAETTPHVVLFDLPFYLWSPTASTGSAIAFKTGFMRDTTHQASPGAYAAGVGFAALIIQLHPTFPRELRNVFEIPANSNIYQLANPLFMTTTGGTAGAGKLVDLPRDLHWFWRWCADRYGGQRNSG